MSCIPCSSLECATPGSAANVQMTVRYQPLRSRLSQFSAALAVASPMQRATLV